MRVEKVNCSGHLLLVFDVSINEVMHNHRNVLMTLWLKSSAQLIEAHTL